MHVLPGMIWRHWCLGGGEPLNWSSQRNTDFVCVCAKPLQLCPTLCDPLHYSQLGSSARETLQAGTLEWVAMPFSRILTLHSVSTPLAAFEGWKNIKFTGFF